MDIERLAKVEEKVDSAHKRIGDIEKNHETYRRDVHARNTIIGNLINKEAETRAEKLAEINLKMNSLDHTNQHINEAIFEFKEALSEVRGVVQSFKEFIIKHNAKNNVWNQLFVGVIKLAGFTATIIGIIKYLEK